jgi:Tol biopolymer transport system component
VRFSPDGKYLGFDLPQSDLGKERDIYVLSIDGDREITAVSSPGNDNIIGWSPDGKWLVFTSDRTGATDLWAVSFTNGRPQGAPLRLKSDIGNFAPLQWTSSGSLYYTTRIGTGSRSQVLSLDFTAGKVVPSLANRNLDSVEQPVWSIDGKRLAYKVGSAHDLLAIRELDTGAVRLVHPTKLEHFYLRTWAPDGRFILVDGTEPRERNGMYRVDTETGEASAVTLYDIPAHPGQTNFVATSTEWMPDGHSFLIAADRGRTGVYRVDSQTGDRSAVFLDEPGQTTVAFKLSPDGKRIFIRRQTQADNRIAFVERDLTSGAENELVRGSLGGIALSPDGRYISTVNTDSPSGSRTVLLIPTDGGESRELTLSSGVNSGVRSLGIPAWTPDGRSLLLRKTPSDSTKEAELWLVPLSGGSPKRITGDGSIPTRAQMSVSPDGRFVHTIAEPSPSSTTEISVLENFLPKTAAAGK